MASTAYGQAMLELLDANQTNPLDLINDAKVKWALFNTGYTPGYSDTVLNTGTAGSPAGPVTSELGATGYGGGYGGADRLAISTPAWTNDTGNSRVEFDADDVTWSSLGNGTNDTIDHVLLIKEDHLGTTGDDTETRVIYAIDVADTTTNGGDVTVSWDAEGIVQYA